jgi:hypothetical protein
MLKRKALRIVGGVLAIAVAIILIIDATGVTSSLASQPTVAQATQTDGLVSSLEAPEWVWAASDWTADQMAAAQPYPMPAADANSSVVSANEAFGQSLADKVPGYVPFTAPEDMDITGDSLLQALMPDFSTSPNGYSYPAPFTRYSYYGKYIKEWPYRTVGKLFFYQNGYAYVCSASSIGNYAIWTAGHCVHDGSGSAYGWSYNVVFVPGYTYGKKQQGGQWKADHLWVMSSWYNSQDLGMDMGGAILDKLKNKSISKKVGALGFAWNWSPEQHWFAMGYPAAYPFDGYVQVLCAASYAYSYSGYSPAPNGIGCDQTGGTSGGPWIFQWGTGWYLNGNMSFRRSGYDAELYSPYFGDAAYNLYATLVADYPTK